MAWRIFQLSELKADLLAGAGEPRWPVCRFDAARVSEDSVSVGSHSPTAERTETGEPSRVEEEKSRLFVMPEDRFKPRKRVSVIQNLNCKWGGYPDFYCQAVLCRQFSCGLAAGINQPTDT